MTIRREVTQLDREQAKAEQQLKNVQERRTALNIRIMKGERSGDIVLDFTIAWVGKSERRQVEQRIRAVNADLRKKSGQLVLVIKRERKSALKSVVGRSRADWTFVETTLKLGISAGKRLDLNPADGSALLPMDKHAVIAHWSPSARPVVSIISGPIDFGWPFSGITALGLELEDEDSGHELALEMLIGDQAVAKWWNTQSSQSGHSRYDSFVEAARLLCREWPPPTE